MDIYPVGQPVFLEIEGIKDNDGLLTDPDTLALTIRKPDGSHVEKTIAELTHVGTGHYLYVYVSAAGEEGAYAFRYESTNPIAVGEGSFSVMPSALLSGDAIVPRTGPCQPWTDAHALADGWTMPTTASDDAIDTAIQAASDVMFQLGGHRWPGVCDDVAEFNDVCSALSPYPEGGVVALRPRPAFGATTGRSVELPGQPIMTVSSVELNGVALDPAAYEVRDWRYLVRIDGGSWPTGGNAGATPAMSVAYTFGQSPPALGRLAATVLARELLLAFAASDDCRLDRRVTDIVREGVSETLALPGLADTLAAGNTGIPEVDLFVHAHNPNRLRRTARFIGL